MSLDLRSPATESIDEMFRAAGAPLEDTPEESTTKNNAMVEQVKGLVERESAINQGPAPGTGEAVMENAATAVKTLGGIGVGIGDIVTNIYNGLVGLTDGFSQYTAENPEGFTPTPKAVNPLSVDANGNPLDLGTGGNVTRAITNFAGPMIAGVATGGGMLAGIGVNAAYNYLAIDPEQERLSDHLKGTWAEDVPVASDLIDYLQTKPTDSEAQSRWKNLMEGLTIDLGVGTMLWGASRAYSGIKRLRNPKTLDEAASKINLAEQEASTAVSRAEASPVAPGEQAALNASDETISTPTPEAQAQAAKAAEEEAQAALSKDLQENPTLFRGANEEQMGANGIDSDAFVEWAANEVRSNPEAFQRGPVSDAAVDAGAKTFTQEEVAEVLRWRPGMGRMVPGTEATRILGAIEQRASMRVRDSLMKLNLDDVSDDALLAYTREMENLDQLTAQADAIASEQGRAFRQNQRRGDNSTLDTIQDTLPGEARDVTDSVPKDSMRPAKILSEITGLTEEESLKSIGQQGRDYMKRAIYKKYGGREGMKDRVTKMKVVSEQQMVENIPDDAFRAKVAQVQSLRKAGYSDTDAWGTVALEGMLSSPTTWGKALFGNLLTTGKMHADNYVAALTPGMSQTLAEANAGAVASFQSLLTGLKPAARAFRTKGHGTAARFNMPATAIKNAEDVAENSAFSWASTIGLLSNNRGASVAQSADTAVQVGTVGNLPRRIMIGIDAYGQHITRQSVIASEAARAGIKSGLSGDDLVEFTRLFKENTPPAVLQKARVLGETNTFAKELSGKYAAAQNTLDLTIGKVPVLNVMLPFTKTAFNVMEYSINNSVLGAVIDSDVKQALRAGGQMREEAITKIMTGTLGTAALMYMAHSGMVKGDDYDIKSYRSSRAFGDEVPRGAAVRVPGTGKWVEIPRGLTPLTTMINTASLLSMGRGYMSDEEYSTAANVFRVAAATQMEASGLAEGVSGLLALSDGQNPVDWAQAGAELATTYTPMSGMLRTIRKAADPVQRDASIPKSVTGMDRFHEALQTRLKNIVPGMSDELPPATNLWGKTIRIPDGLGPDSISPVSVADEGDLQLKQTFEAMQHYYDLAKDKVPGISRVPIVMPERRMTNPLAKDISYEMTPQEYHTFVQLNAGIDPLSGDRLDGKMTLKEAVMQVMDSFDAIGKNPASFSPKEYMRFTGQLNKIFTNYKERARERIVLAKYGDVKDKMREQANRFKGALEVADGGQ